MKLVPSATARRSRVTEKDAAFIGFKLKQGACGNPKYGPTLPSLEAMESNAPSQPALQMRHDSRNQS